MKFYVVLIAALLLGGCIFSNSGDIDTAEQLFDKFHCNNIESNQMLHSSITSYHERTLYNSKQKAQQYIERYKEGETLFNIPLSEVIEQQYLIYIEACQNLGGVPISHETAQDTLSSE
ncbi:MULTISPECIES: hypothetical protein [unclassified Acinetobacter]|uniref:hypothetical protein n=1 Tax=unclassified Acinetobacter TaxID=196816 RepID=UPI002934E5E4|nr:MULTISPECIES: hypothetical protein [unclassified Acinetobacter]WOE31579.1 hypothetical protein QSG84_14940 [Acinetobacter sp. SAAs470]WOE39776.1 hypothetical protein QSG86_08605 [Acinetobacter sp. SAAs474]